jgi:hypothetical protein
LGASNLKRSLHLAVVTARERLTGPLSVHVVMGHGRSYGIEAGYLRKKFFGISQCGLWDELRREDTRSTVAFVTDVGNDLAYEIPVGEVLEWVARCLDRLQECDARVVVTALPLAALAQVGRLRFGLLRALLFPRCRLSQSELLERAEQLDARLRELAKTRNIPIFSVPNAWYGLDPIHPKRAYLKSWWNNQCDLIEKCEATSARGLDSWLMRTYLRYLDPPGAGSSRANEATGVRCVALQGETTITLYS